MSLLSSKPSGEALYYREPIKTILGRGALPLLIYLYLGVLIEGASLPSNMQVKVEPRR